MERRTSSSWEAQAAERRTRDPTLAAVALSCLVVGRPSTLTSSATKVASSPETHPFHKVQNKTFSRCMPQQSAFARRPSRGSLYLTRLDIAADRDPFHSGTAHEGEQ